jgi:hypothetical protein
MAHRNSSTSEENVTTTLLFGASPFGFTVLLLMHRIIQPMTDQVGSPTSPFPAFIDHESLNAFTELDISHLSRFHLHLIKFWLISDWEDLNFLGDSTDISAELQSFETSQFTFPDNTALEVSEIQVLKAGFCIAEMLGCANSVYDITAQRVFD